MNRFYYGTIVCSCGNTFEFEVTRDEIQCIDCGIKHNVSIYPIKETPQEEGEANGTDI